MKSITLNSGSRVSYTLLSDLFVDQYMPRADGEYVKVYIYLLKAIQKNASTFSVSSVAEAFGCAEDEVIEALTFWEKEGLLVLERDGGEIISARLPEESKKAAAKDGTISNDRSRALISGGDENVRVILTIAERYTGRTLSTTDVNRLLYLYDELHLSVDLIDYLIEYCVSNGKRSFRYIESVGVRWYNDGIKTVDDAKANSSLHDSRHYKILRFFGISGRDPLPSEAELMKKWLDQWGFTPELIREACTRALQNTDRQTPVNLFSYTDRILSRWYESRITTLEQVKEADLAHEKKRGSSVSDRKEAGTHGKNPGKTNAFNNFQQRDYDFNDLEQKLLEKTRKNGAS